jgi:hypothetical protein
MKLWPWIRCLALSSVVQAVLPILLSFVWQQQTYAQECAPSAREWWLTGATDGVVFFAYVLLRTAMCRCCRARCFCEGGGCAGGAEHEAEAGTNGMAYKDLVLYDVVSLLGLVGCVLYQTALTLYFGGASLVACGGTTQASLDDVVKWSLSLGVLLALLSLLLSAMLLHMIARAMPPPTPAEASAEKSCVNAW